jgi:uncharacterized protein YndB with AHSA1/START domain
VLNDTHTRNGQLEPAGDQWRLRFTRRLAHPPEKVWRALTEPAHLQTWFPQHIEGDWKAGARLTFKSEGGDFAGQVLTVEPPAVLEFTWGTDTLRFEVEPDGEGSVLTVLDTFAELGKAARDAAGWHECLDNLERALDGQQQPSAPGAVWKAVHPTYVETFGPAAATVGPPKEAQLP